MKNRNLLMLALALLFGAAACNNNTKPDPGKPTPEGGDTPWMDLAFAKGADLSWLTEMEAKDYKFYTPSGAETDCFVLLRSLGCNSVRFRVWVNPAARYNDVSDVLAKCKRAKAQDMQIMIDFHYSDTWADPSKQIIPGAWTNFNAMQIAEAVKDHTRNVLQTLKDNGIAVTWVQIGNEVTPGMLMHTGTESNKQNAPASITGKVEGINVNHFVEYFNAGFVTVKEIYPDAAVILHLDNGWKLDTLTWFFDLVELKGIRYDMIGLSLYPSYWDGSKYPDWNSKTAQCVSNLSTLNTRYGKPVMLVEFGMPASEPEKSKAALQYILDTTKGFDWFKGVFYWEPESEKSRNSYDYGAFSGGSPTAALDPFSRSR